MPGLCVEGLSTLRCSKADVKLCLSYSEPGRLHWLLFGLVDSSSCRRNLNLITPIYITQHSLAHNDDRRRSNSKRVLMSKPICPLGQQGTAVNSFSFDVHDSRFTEMIRQGNSLGIYYVSAVCLLIGNVK